MPEHEDPREEALRRLDERAAALEARTRRDTPDYGAKAAGYGYKLLAEMLGGVFVGLALGLIVDGFAGTVPWGVIAGTLIGFAVSIWMAVRSARRMGEALEKDVGPPRDLPFEDDEDDD